MRQTIGTTSKRDSAALRRATGRAFTLVELLITIAIISILAGLLLGVAARAGERGREARTKAMIARLHTLVMEHYDTYRDRRAPLDDDNPVLANLTGQARAEARLYALRELMIMEMPDRWSDVLLADITGSTPASVTARQPLYLDSNSSSTHGGPTPLIEAYRRQYYASAQNATAEQLLDNQGAECLFMMVMLATADGEARTLFNESSIGDVDGDGAREFLDGWGRPINFLRWAPGYDSDLQANANTLGTDEDVWIAQADADHDPFDLFKSDPIAYRLVPLIFSAGSNEDFGLQTLESSVTWHASVGVSTPGRSFGTQNRRTYISEASRVNPYQQFTGGSVTAFYGTAIDDTATDNITNHNITSE